MKSAINYCLILFLFSFFLYQCSEPESSGEEAHAHEEEAHGAHAEEGNAEVVELSEVQLASIELELGSIDTLNISGFVNANGILDLPPQNIAAVSAPMAGVVKEANKLVGNYVEKGTVLVVLEHPEYIKLQEEYLKLLSQLKFLEEEYQRQRKLDSAEITAKKQFQQVAADYRSAQARKTALEKQLQYLGVSPEWVAKGNMSSTISLRAPINGFITEQNVHKGQFVNAEQELYELADNEHMHLELNIFEEDFKKVEVGQPIRFTVPSLGQEAYQGEVFLMGKSFDPETKTVKVHGHIEGEHENFIRGLYVEARIYTGVQKVQALPEEAIVTDEGKSYIFIVAEDEHAHEEEQKQAVASQHSDEEVHEHEGHEEHTEAGEEHGTTFRRIQIATGTKDQGFVEIKQMPDIPDSTKIVTQGAYYLFSEMKKGEGGHHHH